MRNTVQVVRQTIVDLGFFAFQGLAQRAQRLECRSHNVAVGFACYYYPLAGLLAMSLAGFIPYSLLGNNAFEMAMATKSPSATIHV